MSDDVEVKFGADTKGAEQGIDNVAHKLKDIDVPVRELLEGFGELRKTFVEAFAAKEIAEFITHIAELGEQAVRSSAMLGMSAEQVQKLGFAAKMTGGDAEGMAMGLMRLERNMAEAQDGSSRAAKAFEALGISQQQLKNSSPDQVLGMIADAFHNAKDGADKTAIAMDLMGRSGAQMIPIFDQGSEGLKKMGLVAEQTGSVLTTMQAEGLEKTAQGITSLKASVEGVGISLMGVFKPAIDALISGLTTLVQTLRAAVEMIRVLVDLIEDGIATAIAGVIAKFEEFGVSASTAIGNIKTGFVTLGTVIDDVIHGHFEKAADAWVEGTNKIRQANADAAAQIAKIGQAYDDVAAKIQKATLAALTFGNAGAEGGDKKQLHAPGAGAGKGAKDDTVALYRQDIADQMQLDRLHLETKRALLQEEVDAGQITNAQKLAALRDYANQEYQIQLTALESEEKLGQLSEQQWNKIQDQKLLIAAQRDAAIEKLNLQSTLEQKKQYDTLFNGVKSAMDQMVGGILQGTQSIQQVMIRFADNLAVKFASLAANKLLDWTKSELLSVTVTQTADAAKVASNTAAAGASDAVGAAHLIKEITSSAAATYAGVFAFLSPELGPFAAVPAGVAAGAVGAMTGLVSLDVGAWSVPQNMPAYLHAGEMVVPQNFASGLRDGGGLGGGGDNYTININAIDTQTGAQFLKQNAGVIAASLSSQARNFNPNMRPN